MSHALEFVAPGYGTWEQNRGHNPLPVTRLFQELYPPGFQKGFSEGIEAFGAPVTSATMGFAHGFDYLRFAFLGEPGPDGPPDEATVGQEVMRRAAAAERAFAGRIWRDHLEQWDTQLKPAAQARHRELNVDLRAIDDGALAEHLDACIEHQRAMAYQHHRFTVTSVVVVGDFALHASRWTGRSPEQLLGLFEGYSPISGVWSSEIAAAATALAGNAEARSILTEAGTAGGDAGATLRTLRDLVPEVDEYVRSVEFRVVNGFDLLSPTLAETPGLLLGKLAAATAMGGPANRAGVEKLEAEVRAEVPEEHRATFDALLAEVRSVYRLRDERGVYSDMSSAGLLRLALLELGRRLRARGALDDPELVLHASTDEVRALARGALQPSAGELRARAEARLRAAAVGAPPLLGPPHGPPPPPDALPPALARVAGAIGFMMPAVFGEVEEPSRSGNVIKGLTGNAGIYEGRARIIADFTDLLTLEPGDVLVTKVTSEAFNAAIFVAGAIVTDHGGVASHAAILSREVGIPCVVGTGIATERIVDGSTVVVDGTEGSVIMRT
jgi:phosphohistidine swiveling domain-containing protein